MLHTWTAFWFRWNGIMDFFLVVFIVEMIFKVSYNTFFAQFAMLAAMLFQNVFLDKFNMLTLFFYFLLDFLFSDFSSDFWIICKGQLVSKGNLVSSILPKSKLENLNFCPSLLGQKFFLRFLEEFKNYKKSFWNWLNFSW